MGVSVSGLERNAVQMPLFADERKRGFIAEAMDEINDRYGDFTVTWGTLAERREPRAGHFAGLATGGGQELLILKVEVRSAECRIREKQPERSGIRIREGRISAVYAQ